MTSAAQRIVDALRCGRAGCPCAKEQGKVHCPAHDDNKPSLGVSEGGGKVLVKCHATCSQGSVVAALKERGLWPEPSRNGHEAPRRRQWAAHNAETGKPVGQHIREDRPGEKKRLWWEPKGIKTASLALYRAEVLAGYPDRSAVVSEGEGKTDALASVEDKLGIVAVGTMTGASVTPGDAALRPLVGRKVVLWPDNDDPGRQHMGKIATRLVALGATVRVIAWTGAPPAGDAADAVAAGVDIGALIASAAPWQSGEGETRAAGEPVDLGGLLDDVAAFIRRYVVLNKHQVDAQALWGAHAHVVRAFDTTPYLSIRSPEKRSGKTRGEEVLELLVPNPLKAENVSVAALVRLVDEGATLLLDEVDTIFTRGKASETQEALRGILDSGFRVGGAYVRMSGQGANMQPHRFSTFGPKVLAGIGKLPGTLDDRSIIITMRRKAPGETVERFRYRETRPLGHAVRDRLASWAAGPLDKLRDARPDIPPELDDRAADGWEPLLAIADMAGGDWPQRAREAALSLSSGEAREDDSRGVRLLVDIKTIFATKKAERLPSADIVTALVAMEESPWGNPSGKPGGRPLDTSGLAHMLKPYGIKPKQIRLDKDKTLKGYESADFTDAWLRYLPAPRKGETEETPKHEPVGGVSGDGAFRGNNADGEAIERAATGDSEAAQRSDVSGKQRARGNIRTEGVSGVSPVSANGGIGAWQDVREL